MSKAQFRILFVLGPFLMTSIVPSLLFGILFGEWGTNLIWGSYFGLGWCLSAFASGNIVHDNFSTAIGLIWGWLALVPLYFVAGWLAGLGATNGEKASVGSCNARAVFHCNRSGTHDYGLG